ncbi:MAG: deoxyguanosinetriphosphate triphosphohydrolase [Oxalobacter sp.]|nr:deoxyguanosinetriphosphate triphosphohydrolase [Oxalobacter sp.]
MEHQENKSYQSQWRSLLAPVRQIDSHIETAVFNPARSPFVQDYDRILFSNAFRMLARKTQVHPFASNDHVHHRQMHSLEVSSVGRSLGIMTGYFLKERNDLPDTYTPEHLGQIVQAACLAHDIGNPPFGHGGESALQDWFKDPLNNERYLSELTEAQKLDFMTFDGNAQGFRVLASLENHKDQGGLRLTFPTLASMVKYPRSSLDATKLHSSKFNFYQSEQQIFNEVFTHLGLKTETGYRRHPLSYLTEAADDICYCIIDIEDALELNIVQFNDLMSVVAPVWDRLGIDITRLDAIDSNRRKAGLIRARVIDLMIEATCNVFKTAYETIMDGVDVHVLLDHIEPDVAAYMDNARKLFFDVILKNHSKIAIEIGSYTLYKRMLDTLIPSCHQFISRQPLSFRDVQVLTLMGMNAPTEKDDLYTAYMRVIDFITGLTDRHATFLSTQLAGITQSQ